MESDLDLARRAAVAGAEVGLRYFAALADLPRERKADGTVVTEADRAVEAAVRKVLTAARPGDAILGEEGGATPGEATAGGATAGDRRWIIDPIDGTALFVAGDDRWLVLIALEEAGEITAGVAFHPAQGRMFWAARGAGAYEDGARIEVSPDRTDILADSRLAVIPTDPAVGAALIAVVADVPWTMHPGLMVARGDLDVAVQTAGQIWDFAATSLIVEEAGGRYHNIAGGTRPAAGSSLYARSEPLAGYALEVLRADRVGEHVPEGEAARG